MAIKPKPKTAQKKKTGGKGGGKVMSMEQLANMYYMKGLSKGMGKSGKRGHGNKYGMTKVVYEYVMPKGSVGKGKGKGPKPLKKYQEKLKKVDGSRLVWVCGLSEKTTWKALEKHFAEVVKPTVSDIKERKNKEGKITARVAFKTPEDVETVVAALNGSVLDGEVLEVDKWEKGTFADDKEKPKRGSQKKKRSKLGQVMNLKFAKGSKVKTRDEKTMAKMKSISTNLKVWVGGMSEKTTKQALTKHFADVMKPKLVDMMKNGKAVLAYEKEEDVAAAVAAMNGTELDGNVLEVDVWQKSDKPPREKKGKKGKDKKEGEDD